MAAKGEKKKKRGESKSDLGRDNSTYPTPLNNEGFVTDCPVTVLALMTFEGSATIRVC